MAKIAISTDSNSGLTQKRGEELGIFVLPMPFTINDKECIEGVSLKHSDFFRLQKDGAHIFSSQPSPGSVIDFWNKILEEYDTIIHIPMSSSLSGSFSTAQMLAQDYDGKVVVIDNFRLSATQMQSCIDARKMVLEGKSAEEICSYLMTTREDAIIYVAVDDLKYLKEGGRLKPAAASMATLLNIKPILMIGTEKLDAVAKPRGMKAARKNLLKLLDEDMEKRFHTTDVNDLNFHIACSLPTQEALEWREVMEEHFGTECTLDRLPLSLAIHTGFGALGVGITKRYK